LVFRRRWKRDRGWLNLPRGARAQASRVRAGRVLSRLVLLLAFVLGGRGGAELRATATPPPLPGVCSESDRFAVGHDRSGRPIDAYEVGVLQAGWYTDFGVAVDPPRPAGMGYVQVVRVSDDGPYPNAACSRCPTWDEVRSIAQQNPGSVWFIGNEPDRQDYVSAGRYAELYHAFYTFLKAEDPASSVGPGGVVQPTPIRLQYLDLILDAYQTAYGEPMPVDVWNVHNYVLREGATGWGCGIPPGTDPSLAQEYGIQDHDNMDYWTEHLERMREWMRDRGYRDRPLVVTEFGILMPQLYGYDAPRVRDFMLATFDWLRTATDADTGYPADGNRLVQAWAWFSLAEANFEGWATWNHLFDPDTTFITPLGLSFATYTTPLTTPFAWAVDLQVTAIQYAPSAPTASGLVTATVAAQIHNAGGSASESVVVRFQRDGVLAGEVALPPVAAGGSASAHVVWPTLGPGWYQVTATADPDGQAGECDRSNNTLSVTRFIGGYQSYLPTVQRAWKGVGPAAQASDPPGSGPQGPAE
jgi:hypothetical protein